MARAPSFETPQFGAPMILAFLRHQEFNKALRHGAVRKAKLYGDLKPLHRFASDRGSSLLGIFALSLHFSEQGLSVGGLQAMRAESSFCSAGRAAAFIATMRKRADFMPADNKPRTRVSKLVISERFISFERERLRADIESLEMLSPLGEFGLAQLDKPAFFAGYMRVAARGLGRQANEHVREVEFFQERNTGLLALYDIIADSEDALESKPVAVSISQLSKRFDVSRTHILRLLRDADAEGLVVWQADERLVTLTPKLVRALHGYVAFILAGSAYCIWMAAEELGLL
jgi:hypothetical protein